MWRLKKEDWIKASRFVFRNKKINIRKSSCESISPKMES